MTAAFEAKLDLRVFVHARHQQRSIISRRPVVATCAPLALQTFCNLRKRRLIHVRCVGVAVRDKHLHVLEGQKCRIGESLVALWLSRSSSRASSPSGAPTVSGNLGFLKHSLSHTLLKPKLPVVSPARIAHNPSATAALHPTQTSRHIRGLLFDQSPPASTHSPPVLLHLVALQKREKRGASSHQARVSLDKARARPPPVPPNSHS